MAEKFGVSCPAIRHYMANKAQVRSDIASGAGITVEQAKKCMLSVLYGARASSRVKDAIPSAIGLDAARRLYAQPPFQALRTEVQAARRAILAGWPRTANGSLTNACGRAMRGDANPADQLAHLVQGAEAKALMSVVNLHAEDILLLQHDGFAAGSRLDCSTLEQAVFDGVGYRLSLEERRLELYAEPRELMIRMKNEMARETALDMGSDSVSAD